MTQALANHQARVNGELFADMQREWDAGRVVALNDSVGSGMKRKPIGTTRI
jgi:serine/threonine-protein kinase HipA